MPISLTFLEAVALAGLAYLLGEALVERSKLLQRYLIPEPLLSGLLAAFGILLLRITADLHVEMPVKGRPVDFLISLLTANMGLHVTPRDLRQAYKVFGLFLGAATLLYFLHLILVLPLALLTPHPLPTAVLLGPVSFVGIPFNLNPPAQIEPMAELFRPAYPDAQATAQAMMMLGVMTGLFLSGFVGRQMLDRVEEPPPRPSAEESPVSPQHRWQFAVREARLVILILVVIALAFNVQDLLLRRLPWMEPGYLPVIVLSYLFGAAFRLGWEVLAKRTEFPEAALTVLLLGPTMSLVLTYAVMSIPLYRLMLLTPPMVLAGLAAIGGSALVAWLVFRLFRGLTQEYYAAVIATAFLAVTTGWGPMGMSYLRRYTDQEGPVRPIAVVLPLNAFFLFPWMVILVSRLLVRLFG